MPDDISPASDVGKAGSKGFVQPDEGGVAGSRGDFRSLMEGGVKGRHVISADTQGRLSPFDLAARQDRVAFTPPSHEGVTSHMQETSNLLGSLQDQLHNKDLRLKQSEKQRLGNRLMAANQGIRAAAKKVGVDSGAHLEPSFNAPISRNPVHRFIALLSDSQQQLSSAKAQMSNIGANNRELNPGAMLTMQLKLANAQQELEYASILLSTATGGIKTIFNIQI